MNQNKLYSLKDIDILKQKLETYKKILDSVKEGGVINDYLLTKKENQEIKEQLQNLEGVIIKMKEEQTRQLSHYEGRHENNANQLQDVNFIFEHLQRELKDLKNTINILNVTQLDKKLNTLMELQQTLIARSDQGKKKANLKKEEILPEHEVNTNLPNQDPKLLPSSYKKLQNLLQSSNQTQYQSDQKKTFTQSDAAPQQNRPINQDSRQIIPSSNKISNHKNPTFFNSIPVQGAGALKVNPMRRIEKPGKNHNQFDIANNNMNIVAKTKIPNIQNPIQDEASQKTKMKPEQPTPIEKEQPGQSQE